MSKISNTSYNIHGETTTKEKDIMNMSVRKEIHGNAWRKKGKEEIM